MNARPEDTVLDCLLSIKRTIDPTLAFRYSCGHGMCGSDAVAINGTPTLLCTATIKDWAKQPNSSMVDDEGFRHTGDVVAVEDGAADDSGSLGVIELAPLPGFPVQRDLIADIDQMLDQIRSHICRRTVSWPPPPKVRSMRSNICNAPNNSPNTNS